MPVPVSLSALVIALALVPGWLYLRLVERLRPPSPSSALHQLMEVLAVGVATTGTSVLVVLLVPHRWLPFSLNVDMWAAKGASYVRSSPRPAVWTVALVFAMSLLIAYGLYGLRAVRTPGEFGAGTVWVHSLGTRPRGKIPYVGLHLDDGRLLEGALHSYSLGDADSGRDVALAAPIRITPPGEPDPLPLPHLDRVIVPASRIAYITVIHAPKADG